MTTLRHQPRIYNIPPGQSFVDALAAGLLERCGDDPAALTAVTVLLPNRRAVRALTDAFLRLTGGRAMLLPTMRPIGNVDEDELLLFADTADLDMELPPAAPPLWRLTQLAQLVQHWETRLRGEPALPAQAAKLAAALAQLLDQAQTEGVDLHRLKELAPQEFATHWQRTLEFLNILTEHWPNILRDGGYMDPAARRNHLLAALAQRWKQAPPDHPVIAAGSTGSIPATAKLLHAVARLPQGGVVLPGLDTELDGDAWDAIKDAPTHPQYTMWHLLTQLGATREDVLSWRDVPEAPGQAARRRLLSLALRPAAVTDAWRDHDVDVERALGGMTLVEAASEREEAGVIALMLRQALETAGRTAALVTPDRGLARRVAAELGRWGIVIDDSAGLPLADTPPGAFLHLLADMLSRACAPAALLAVLKHPLAAGGMAAAEFRARVRDLERRALRGPRPAPGLTGVAAALGDGALGQWWAGMARRLDDFAVMLDQDHTLADLIAAHVAAAEALAADDQQSGALRLWRDDDGRALSAFLSQLMEAGRFWRLHGADYPALLQALMADAVARPAYGRHPRLKIWGTLEARLQQADVLILGGLNEGVWPPDPGVDPWLSRPMRQDFGLPPLERRVGLAAHDFVQGAAAAVVILTRAARVDGTPTVPSRWLQRLRTVTDGALPDGPWLAWHRRLDAAPDGQRPYPRPAPRPPLSARPTTLPVTQLQVWMRDPYAIYARHILKLKPLDPLDADPGAAEKGTLIHQILEKFMTAYPGDLPPDALARLLDIGRDAFAAFIARPAVRAFWWPRFVHVAEWFVAMEQTRRRTHATVVSEGSGVLNVGAFTVTAKADRIDRGPDGGLVIIDYKTGNAPTPRELFAGYAPQLPVEGLMAAAGGFPQVPAATVTGLEFWRLHGGDPPADIKEVADIDQIMAVARRGVQALVAQFAKPDTPYLSQPRPALVPAGDYDHLARVKEWGNAAALAAADADQGDDA